MGPCPTTVTPQSSAHPSNSCCRGWATPRQDLQFLGHPLPEVSNAWKPLTHLWVPSPSLYTSRATKSWSRQCTECLVLRQLERHWDSLVPFYRGPLPCPMKWKSDLTLKCLPAAQSSPGNRPRAFSCDFLAPEATFLRSLGPTCSKHT